MKDLIERLRNGYPSKERLEAADAIHALNTENTRLTECLRIANNNHEEFERKWYLATDENAQLKAELAAMRAAPIFGFHWRRGWEWGFSLTGDFNASDKSSFTPLYAAPGAKQGWKLVPIEPTDEMALAALKASLNDRSINGVAQWRAMIAAAPEAV